MSGGYRNGKQRIEGTQTGIGPHRSRFLPHVLTIGKLCMSSPLWRTRLREPLVPCGDGHSFHTSDPLCTGVDELPVGDVGNRGSTAGRRYRISKSPELHRQDLENPAPAQVVMVKPLPKDFHFSCYNYGDYCLFLLSNYSFPTPPSHCTAGSVEREAEPHKTAASIFKRTHRPATESSRFRTSGMSHCSGQPSRKPPHQPRNSEIYPAFPPTPGSRR